MQVDDPATAAGCPSATTEPSIEPLCVADDLSRTAIRAALIPAAGNDGGRWHVRVVDETGSTNSDLLADVRRTRGADLPAILVARHQTAGRGRLGRQWTTWSSRSLAASFALHVPRRLAHVNGVTLVCGLAAHAVVSGRGVAARLKWPNDVLVGDRKLAGILVEAVAVGEGTVLVIGVGANLDRPGAFAGDNVGTSFAEEGVALPDRSLLTAELAQALSARLARFAVDGFAPFVDAWRAADAFAGRRVVLHAGGTSSTEGVHRGVDVDGALLIEVDGTVRRFTGGEISVRLVPPS